MFINLTNHPSSGWSEEQLQTAQQYGTIVDFPFPNIEPSFSKKDVRELADKVVGEIRDLNVNPVVHVMGEMTFTFAVVSRLKNFGITCVASTTERIVQEKDGKKISEFKFVQFREY